MDLVSSCRGGQWKDCAGVETTHPDIDVGDVADDVVLCIQDWERGHSFVVHQLESRGQRLVAAVGLSALCVELNIHHPHSLDSQNLLLPDVQILEELRIQLVHGREARPVLPEELDQPQLRQHTHHIRRTLFRNKHSMHATAKHLHSLGQIGSVR